MAMTAGAPRTALVTGGSGGMGRVIAARLAALLPGTRQVEPPWAGHFPTLERPQELSGILTAFMREIVPAG